MYEVPEDSMVFHVEMDPHNVPVFTDAIIKTLNKVDTPTARRLLEFDTGIKGKRRWPQVYTTLPLCVILGCLVEAQCFAPQGLGCSCIQQPSPD